MADIKTHSTLPTSLVSVWELQETSGTRVDSHGSNDLTDNNTVLYGTGKVLTNAADFEASNSEYLDISDASQSGLDLSGDLSIAAWVKIETDSGDMTIASKINSGQVAYELKLQDLGIPAEGIGFVLSANGSTLEKYEYTQTFNTGTWYHIVVTLDISAKTMQFYVNGSNIGNDPTGTATSIHNSTAPFRIGAGSSGTSNNFDGLIEQVCVWSKELTSGEVSDLYNSGSGIPYEEVGGGVNTSRNLLLLGVG